MYHRLVRHPLRTYDPAEATIFFVPYDGGLDATVSAWDGRSLKARCPRSGIVSGYLTHNSTAQTYLRRNGGSDHFIIFSVIQGVSSLSSPGCRRLYREVCKGCRKLAIEVSYHRGDLPVITSGKASKVYSYDPTWVSVPYPSSFHYTERVKRAAWVSADDSTEIHNHLDKNHRVTHAIYIGGMHTANKMSNRLRRQLAESCNAVEDRECTWIAMGKAGARYSAADVLKQYESSTFCLHPPGDSPTRKGIFDSLLAGCIPGKSLVPFPLIHARTAIRGIAWHLTSRSVSHYTESTVVFDKYTFGDQYTWHIRRADIHEVSVYVPPTAHATFLQFLDKIEPARVKAIQKRIARIAFSLQYSLPPTGPAARVWSPPKQDAVDLILVGMAGQPTRRER